MIGRTISPSEATDFQFCQKFWYNRRHLCMIPQKIGYKELAAMMGQTVGWMYDLHIRQEPFDGIEYFTANLEAQLALGRQYDYNGVEEYVPKVKQLILNHFKSLCESEPRWLGDGKIIASEPVMAMWGNSRQDLVVELPSWKGMVVDIKCKLKADSPKFATSRDIDLNGNQAQMYPLAWNSLNLPLKIKVMRFVYLQDGREPIIEDTIINIKRTERWLQAYHNVVGQINILEAHPESMANRITENPYHITPWGYPCEYLNYCMQGEDPQGALGEFIQIERVRT